MKQGFKKIATAIFIIAATLFFLSSAFSQTTKELEAELKKIEAQITAYEKELASAKTQKQTLSNKIAQLKKEQEKISLQIKATNLEIGKLGKQLSATETSIRTTGQKLSLLKGQAAEIIRAIYERGEKSLIETFLKEDGLSALFDELESLQELSQGLNKKLDEVKTVKIELESRHSNLETKQGEKKNLLGVQALQRQNLQTKTTEQNKILKETQGKEISYQAMLADSKKRAQEIRNRIYELLGVGKQITFGEAVGIAQWASSYTGVRPEFLLAVLNQESNLGKNVGQCNLADTGTGSTRSIRSGNVFLKGIHPGRDLPPFLVITRELGMNPLTTPISCPIPSVGGWGGAMGPAQFIPSTWVLYKNKVSTITGKPANPWDIRDAFLAAALLLKDNGAAGSRSDAEWRAAMLYFSGSTDPRFRSYGDNVVAKANDYENDIRALSG